MVPNLIKYPWIFALGAVFTLLVIRAAHRAGYYDLVQVAIGQDHIVE